MPPAWKSRLAVPTAGRCREKGVLLEAKCIAKRWPGRPFLFRDLTISVPLRTITAIVGGVGVGKTSLLRCFAGVEPVTEGEVVRRAPVLGLVTVPRDAAGPIQLLSDPVEGPRIIVCDEPTLYLTDRTDDPYSRPEAEQVIAHLRSLVGAGHAVITATHDPLVQACADEVVEL